MSTETNSDLVKNYDPLKNELLQSGLVTAVSTSSSPATAVWSHTDLDKFPGKRPGETVERGIINESDNYFKTFGLKIQAGRDFIPGAKSDTNNAIFNEAAIKRLRLTNPLNQIIVLGGQQFR